MRVDQLRVTDAELGREWSGRVSTGRGELFLRFSAPEHLVDDGDASLFLAATLLPAMVLGEDLEIDGPVSPRLLRRAASAASIYHQMERDWLVPRIQAAGAPDPRTQTPVVGCFLSRGVDSMYSAAVPREDPGPLDALVFCESFEPGPDTAVRPEEVRLAGEVAGHVGLPLHRISTNLHELTNPLVGWSDMHGGGLAALALLCGGGIGSMVIPSAYDVTTLAPLGSHPALDPLFSTESVEVIHDSLVASRQGKIDWLVAHRPELLPYLKVCYAELRPDNCGRCRKCLLTMASLRANRALDRATGFPPTIDLEVMRSLRFTFVATRLQWVQTAERLIETGADDDLLDTMRHVLRTSARPSRRERIEARLRWRSSRTAAFDPERAPLIERCWGNHTDAVLAVVRRGELPPSVLQRLS
jgi:hypothetical protein